MSVTENKGLSIQRALLSIKPPLLHRSPASTAVVTMVAAGTSQFIHHPLYTLKTHMQSEQHFTLRTFVQETYQKKNPLKFLYKGVRPLVFGCMPGMILKMQAWTTTMNFMERPAQRAHFGYSFWSWLLAGSAAGAATTLFGCPAELLMVQAQTRNCGISELAKQQSLARLYTGAPVTLCRDVGFNAIFFTLRQSALRLSEQHTGVPPSAVTKFVLGAIAGCIAATATCPLDVVKTRLQETNFKNEKVPFYRLLVQIARHERASALFHGLAPRLVAVPSMMSATLLLHDKFKMFVFGSTS